MFARSLEMRDTSDALNLCRGETTTLLNLARTILEVAGEKRPVHAPDTATHGVLARRSTNQRLRERFGLSTFTGLADGLRPTIAWYREAYRGGRTMPGPERDIVIGADGFLGRNLVPRLRAEGREVVEIGRAAGDLSDWANVERALRAAPRPAGSSTW